jgi:tetratricopeptide (TPR) repeat protein/O-antigen ligase
MGTMQSERLPLVQTKLGLFCNKIIEAGWLTAAIVTPLFFNWYSNRVFEASKVTLLCSITLLMLAAWLIKTLETRSWKLEAGSWRRKASTQHPISSIRCLLSRNPLLLPSLLLLATHILTTITSISPRISFWGSYHRRQGLYVALSYITTFLLMLATLRTRRQLERLITAILLTSLPISLYGIMQRYGVDPLIWIRGGAHRVESTLGNPILIGAYVIMVVPLTVWKVICSFSLIRTREKKLGVPLALLGCYLLLLILQLICLAFTQSRGPMMSLVAGALFFFLLWAVLRGQRGLTIAVVSVSVALLVILAVLNLPNSPLALPKGIPYVGRLDEITKDIVQDRSLIWQGAVSMITVDKIRVTIGYGLESMGLIFYPYLHPDWWGAMYTLTADRCHNETLDALVTGGLIGLVAYLVLFGSVFYYGVKWLGLIASSRQRNLFIVTCLVGGSLGALIPWLVEGTFSWTGVGIPAGILLALVVYLMTSIFQRSVLSLPVLSIAEGSRGGEGGGRRSDEQILLIALLSALVTHFVEIQFGIAITATRTYFWLYAALLAIIGYRQQRRPEPVEEEEPIPKAATETLPPASSGQRRDRRRRARKRRVARPWAGTPARLSGSALSYSLLAGLIMATTGFDLITHQFDLRANGPVILSLLFAIWLLGGILTLSSSSQFQSSNFSTYVLGSLFCFLPSVAAHSFIILPGAGVERATVVFYVYIFSVILAVAVALMMGSNLYLPLYRFRAWGLYPILGIGILLVIFNTNLKVAQADIYYKFALSSEETGKIDEAIALYRHAIQLTPRWDQYYASLGWAYGLKATTASDASERTALFEESRKALDHARQMSPLDPDIATKLGHVYWNWGGLTPDPGQRAEKLEAALAHYQQAVTLSPLNHGRLLKDNIVKTYLRLGATYTAIGKLSQAEETYQKANEMAPDGHEGHKGLASVYLQLGRIDEALEEARAARDLAPEEERPDLDDLIAQLEAQKK